MSQSNALNNRSIQDDRKNLKLFCKSFTLQSSKLRPSDLFLHDGEILMYLNPTPSGLLAKKMSDDTYVVIGKNEKVEIIRSLDVDRSKQEL